MNNAMYCAMFSMQRYNNVCRYLKMFQCNLENVALFFFFEMNIIAESILLIKTLDFS